MRARSLLPLASLLIACTQPATSVVGIVGSDYPSPDLLSEVRVRATIGADRVDGHVFSMSEMTLPLSFGVAPGEEGISDYLTIEVEARSVDGLLSLRRAVVPFVEQRSMALPLFLAASCRDVSCEEGQTCTESGCAPEAIDPSGLQDIVAGQEAKYLPPATQTPEPTPEPTPTPEPEVTTYALQVMRDGDGTVRSTNVSAIDCGTTCRAELDSTTSVTLTAIPDSGRVFEGWTGDCIGAGDCTVSMATPRYVTARFVTAPTGNQQLEVALLGGGAGRVRADVGAVDCPNVCRADYPSTTQVTLTAEPAGANEFAGWSGACTGMGACVVSMAAPRRVEARFEKKPVSTMVDRFDLTGDGAADLVFSAPRLDASGPRAGRVYVARGPVAARANALGLDLAWDGAPGDRFGEALALPGDMNDDGYADLMIGAPGAAGGLGAVYVVAGGPQLPARGRLSGNVAVGVTNHMGFGASIAVLPDLDGDGKVELAVGAPGGTSFPGAVMVFMSDRPAGPVSSAADATFILQGEHPGDAFGMALAWVGDVDGDGVGELAVGAPGASVGSQFGVGRVYLFRDPAHSTVRSASGANWTLSGDAPSRGFGLSIAALGDWNADGREDFAVSSPVVDAVYVYPPVPAQGPMTSGSVANAPLILNSTGLAGMSLAGAGDFDGDGFRDLAVGAPGYSGMERGALLIYRGGAAPSLQPAFTWTGTCMDEGRCMHESVGISVASIGDLDGDGMVDLAVGSAFGGGPAGSYDRGRIAVLKGVARAQSGSIEQADVLMEGEDQAGLCSGLPGATPHTSPGPQ